MTRSTFNFSSGNIRRAAGYVLGEVYDVVESNGEVIAYTFKPVKVILEKLITKGGFSDFRKLEELCIENCSM